MQNILRNEYLSDIYITFVDLEYDKAASLTAKLFDKGHSAIYAQLLSFVIERMWLALADAPRNGSVDSSGINALIDVIKANEIKSTQLDYEELLDYCGDKSDITAKIMLSLLSQVIRDFNINYSLDSNGLTLLQSMVLNSSHGDNIKIIKTLLGNGAIADLRHPEYGDALAMIGFDSTNTEETIRALIDAGCKVTGDRPFKLKRTVFQNRADVVYKNYSDCLEVNISILCRLNNSELGGLINKRAHEIQAIVQPYKAAEEALLQVECDVSQARNHRHSI